MGIDNDFPCFRIDNRFVECLTKKSAFPAQFLTGFITAYAGHIIAAGVKEQPFEKIAGTFYCRRFTGTEFLVDFYKSFILRFCRILFKRSFEAFIIIEKIEDIGVSGPAKSADKYRHGNLTVTVNTGIDDIIGIGFQFNPGTAVRDDRRIVQADAHGVDFTAIVHTW